MTELYEEIQEVLSGYSVTIDLEDEGIEIYLLHPSSEDYDEILGEIDELCDYAGYTVDGDYEGHLSVY